LKHIDISESHNHIFKGLCLEKTIIIMN